ncbi:MAG: LysE family transporter, partial [bacterium]
MGNLTLFATAFMVAFSGAMMPGPLLTVAINQSLRRGIVVGPLISLGHGLMEILVVGALLVGLGQLLEHGLVAAAVALGGGLVLAWMGYGMIREGWQGEISLDLEQGKEQRDGKGAFAAGVVATVANPYWLLWWATIGANFVALARQGGALGLVSFFSGHILADFLWYTLVAF